MTGRIKALVLLALALLRTLWRRAAGEQEPGLQRFRENYAEDGLTAISAADRAQMGEFGRCIACGRCNQGDGPQIAEARGRYHGTMTVVLAASRSMPDYGAAASSLLHWNDADLERKEALCPTGVPLRRLAAFVRAHAAAARVSLPRIRGAKRMPSSFPPRSSGTARAKLPSGG